MAVVTVLLVLGAAWTHQVSAECKPDVLDKIKTFGINNANSLAQLVGDWKLVHFEGGISMTESFATSQCDQMSFLKEGDVYKVDYRKFSGGVHDIKERDGALVDIGGVGEPDMSYYPVELTPELVTLYACYKEQGEGSSMSLVLAPMKSTDYQAKLEAAKEKLKSIGLPAGMDNLLCPTTTEPSTAAGTITVDTTDADATAADTVDTTATK